MHSCSLREEISYFGHFLAVSLHAHTINVVWGYYVSSQEQFYGCSVKLIIALHYMLWNKRPLRKHWPIITPNFWMGISSQARSQSCIATIKFTSSAYLYSWNNSTSERIFTKFNNGELWYIYRYFPILVKIVQIMDTSRSTCISSRTSERRT
jgi:hypothetical protein